MMDAIGTEEHTKKIREIEIDKLLVVEGSTDTGCVHQHSNSMVISEILYSHQLMIAVMLEVGNTEFEFWYRPYRIAGYTSLKGQCNVLEALQLF